MIRRRAGEDSDSGIEKIENQKSTWSPATNRGLGGNLLEICLGRMTMVRVQCRVLLPDLRKILPYTRMYLARFSGVIHAPITYVERPSVTHLRIFFFKERFTIRKERFTVIEKRYPT